MSGTEISKLTAFAQNYIKSANIDENNNGIIEDGRELNRLLAGTTSNSIEDLTVESIKQKVLENDTEKIFTAFMTEKGLKNATRPYREYLSRVTDVINSCRNNISSTIVSTQNNFKSINSNVKQLVHMLEKSSDISSNTVKFYLKNIKIGLNTLEESVQQQSFFGNWYLYCEDKDDYTPQYKKTEGLYECNLSQHLEFVQNLKAEINALNEDEINADEYLPVLKNLSEQINSALDDYDKMVTHYCDTLQNDENIVIELQKKQSQFMADGVSSEEEKGEAKELLGELIEQVSPWSRELLLQQAEVSYKYDKDSKANNNDDTKGINQTSQVQNVKRSSYQTEDGIYKLSGDKVFVYNRAGQMMRTEKLDSTVHTRFFE